MNTQRFASDGLSSAGLAIILVPQAVAYASLAGASPAQGIVAAALAPMVFFLLPGGRTLSPGPVAIIALLSAEAARQLATEIPSGAPIIQLTALGIGLTLTIVGLLRAGFLLSFVSEPVLIGFMSAAAIIIGVSQVPSLLGIPVAGRDISTVAQQLLMRSGQLSIADAAVGITALSVLLSKSRIAALLPERMQPTTLLVLPLLVVGAAALLAFLVPTLELSTLSPVTLSSIGWSPPWDYWRNTPEILRTCAGPAALAVLIARAVQSNTGGTARDNKSADNLCASLGASNALSGLTGGMAIGVSVSRSSLAKDLNVSSAWPHILAGIVVAAVAFAAGSAFAALPHSVVAALIISALPSVFDFQRMAQIVRYNAFDATAMAITFFSVIGLGVQRGLVIGGVTALALYLYRTTRLRIVPIGRVEGDNRYEEAERKNVNDPAGERVLTLRIGEDLYFANSDVCEEKLNAIARDERPSAVVLDMRSVGTLDSSAVLMLTRVRDAYGRIDIELRLSRLKRGIEKRLRVAGFLVAISSDGRNAPSVNDAVNGENGDGESGDGESGDPGDRSEG